MNKFIKLKWVLLFCFVVSIPIFTCLIHQSNRIKNLEDEIDTKEHKINELNDEVEELKNSNEELKTALQNNNALQQQTHSFEDIQQNNLKTESATVVYRKSGCSYFILKNNQGYIVAEWFGGTDPEIGETVVGKFDSFGFKDYVTASNSDCRLWIEDYMISKETALEKVNDNCD